MDSTQESGYWFGIFIGDLSQTEKLSEIKLPLEKGFLLQIDRMQHFLSAKKFTLVGAVTERPQRKQWAEINLKLALLF